MKQIVEIYRYTFKYTGYCLAVIGSNLLYVLFNLLSLVLFIPFLQVIFPTGDTKKKELIEPIYNGGFADFFIYIKNYYQFFMESKANENPISALLFVCVTVLIAFFLKNVFRYMAVFFQSFVRMAVVRDIRLKLFEK